MSLNIPTLETERVRLRGWREEDLDAYAAFIANEATVRFLGGIGDRKNAWRRMAMLVGHWVLRGYGPWVIEEKASGHWIGYSGLWNPEGWPEPELMWGLAAHVHGRGYATEAARRAREFAYRNLGWTTLTSYIDPRNHHPCASRSGSAPRTNATSSWGHPVGLYRHPGLRNCTLDHNKEKTMSVKIRLSRGGTKKRPYYYVVVADSASPRDGRYIEQVGTHNPLLAKDNADRVKLDLDRIKHWLSVGAQPTDRVARFIDAAGLAKRETPSNPNKAKPKKKRLEREAAQAEAAAKKAADGEAKPAA